MRKRASSLQQLPNLLPLKKPSHSYFLPFFFGHLLYDISYQICYFYKLAFFRFIWSSTVGHELPNLLPLKNPSDYSFFISLAIYCMVWSTKCVTHKEPFLTCEYFFPHFFLHGTRFPFCFTRISKVGKCDFQLWTPTYLIGQKLVENAKIQMRHFE